MKIFDIKPKDLYMTLTGCPHFLKGKRLVLSSYTQSYSHYPQKIIELHKFYVVKMFIIM